MVGVDAAHVQPHAVPAPLGILRVGHAAPGVGLRSDGAADHVARGQVGMTRGVALHERLALGVAQHTALGARSFGQEDAGMRQPSGVELHELHILKLQTGVQGQCHAVAGQIPRVRRGVEQPARASRGQHDVPGVHGVHGAGMRIERHHALDLGARLVQHQVGHIPFLGECDAGRHALLPQRVQDLVTDAVGGVGGALDRLLAEVGGMPAEAPLRDMSVLGAREGHPHAFEVDDRGGGLLREQPGRILVDQPVAALDRVIVMPHQHGGLLAQGPAFGESGGVDHTQRRRQTGRAGADDHDIIHCFDMLRTHSLDSRTTAVIMEP